MGMKRKTIFILGVLLILSLSLSLTGCSGSQSDDESKAPAAVDFKVGLECAYPPFNWTQPDDSNGAVPIQGSTEFAGGYDVEIAKMLAEGMGKNLVIVKTEWDGLPPSLQSGTIDAIIAGMSPTADRKKTIDFSDHYYRSDLVMVVQKGSAFETATSLEDFTDAKITAQLNTFHYSVIDQIPGVKKQTAMNDFNAMRVALQSGIIDGYVSERPEGVSATAANSNFSMVVFDEGKGFEASDDDVAIAVGIKKGNTELTEAINEILKGISEEDRITMMDNAIKNQPASQE